MKFDFLKNINLDKCILFISGGKDSIVSLDLLKRYANIRQLIGVYFYFIPDLQYKNEILDYYSNKYNFEIKQIPHPFFLQYKQNQVYGIKNDLDRKYT